MKVYLIIPSINPLINLRNLVNQSDNDLKIIVVDEGNGDIRKLNDKLLSKIPHEYYGPKERERWFKDRFGTRYGKYLAVIPEKCHAETSFGFLKAYEDNADVIIEIDDDVHVSETFVREHIDNLFNPRGVSVNTEEGWYNTMENLYLNTNHKIFPRGHPYDLSCRRERYVWTDINKTTVLNMGLWKGHPDLDAITILHHGGLDGRCGIQSQGCKRKRVIPDFKTYFALCSMNTSFLRKIVPSYYQLYMNHMNVDRFDDIWSGVFLKRIADHLGDGLSIGKPLCTHAKRERNVFKDLEKEIMGLEMNEVIWKISSECEFYSKTYADCYLELCDSIEKFGGKWLRKPWQLKFWKDQTEKMRRWIDIIDQIS